MKSHQESRTRLLGRTRHLHHHSLAEGELRLRSRRRGGRRRPGRGDRRSGARRRIAPARATSISSTRRKSSRADYLFPVLKAGAIYEHDYLLGTSTARPLIARKQVEIALATGCDALAHGCTGKGNDQVRFELAYQALAPELAVIAPWREWTIVSREDAIDYASARGIPVPVTKKDPYSRDRNLWHLSHEGGPLEDPSFEPEASMFKLTVDPMDAPDTPEKVTIAFEAGHPGGRQRRRRSRRPQLVQTLNAIGGRHGVGRADIVENRLIGIKSRGVYETPGGTLLVTALKALESITLDRDTAHEKERIATRYAELVYNGQWFSPLREAFDAFVDTPRRERHRHGHAQAVQGQRHGRRPASRRTRSTQQDLASFDMTGYDVTDSAGFIRLFGLQLRGRKRLAPMDVGDEVTEAVDDGSDEDVGRAVQRQGRRRCCAR